jgi:hypothetical protein
VKLQAPFATLVEAQDDVAIMALSGELDMSTAPILREELAEVEDSGTLAIVLDLRESRSSIRPGSTSSWRRGAVPKQWDRLLMSGATLAARRLIELTGTQFLLDERE